ncbi:FAD-dependent oxidoreductase [Streptomyces sp. NPDC005408]|uniref:NAD(P)/FAD-dependent oxidoreductase n=1 Tax=Streptomyces sp. NPDC005408 TaxID=3155341 RepID=UPI0033ABADFE
MGPRPMTPDGLPLIGPVPGRPGVLLATGHNMLGLMLGPATGRLVTGLLTGRADPGLAAAFTPARSARRRRVLKRRTGATSAPPAFEARGLGRSPSS